VSLAKKVNEAHREFSDVDRKERSGGLAVIRDCSIAGKPPDQKIRFTFKVSLKSGQELLLGSDIGMVENIDGLK
jgi:hypothetical protein